MFCVLFQCEIQTQEYMWGQYATVGARGGLAQLAQVSWVCKSPRRKGEHCPPCF